MQTSSSFEFVESMRQAFELVTRLVWQSHAVGLSLDTEWPESEFFSALITQGFRGLDPRTRNAFSQLDNSDGPFRIRIECERHNQQTMEPITGADLGVVFTFTINQRKATRRGFLVQLKKATQASPDHPSIQMSDLHHFSGKQIWGEDLHQADKMLRFSNAAVYWIAVPPNARMDRQFFSKYVEATNLAARKRTRELGTREGCAATAGHGLASTFPLLALPWMDLPELDWCLSRWASMIGRTASGSPQDIFKQLQDGEADRLYCSLRCDAAAAAHRQYGMRSMVPVIAAHAESVLALHQRAKAKGLVDIYPSSVSLSEFLLGDVVADGFGDPDGDFIDAILLNKPNDYIRDVVAGGGPRPDLPDNSPVVRQALSIGLSVEVAHGDSNRQR